MFGEQEGDQQGWSRKGPEMDRGGNGRVGRGPMARGLWARIGSFDSPCGGIGVSEGFGLVPGWKLLLLPRAGFLLFRSQLKLSPTTQSLPVTSPCFNYLLHINHSPNIFLFIYPFACSFLSLCTKKQTPLKSTPSSVETVLSDSLPNRRGCKRKVVSSPRRHLTDSTWTK